MHEDDSIFPIGSESQPLAAKRGCLVLHINLETGEEQLVESQSAFCGTGTISAHYLDTPTEPDEDTQATILDEDTAPMVGIQTEREPMDEPQPSQDTQFCGWFAESPPRPLAHQGPSSPRSMGDDVDSPSSFDLTRSNSFDSELTENDDLVFGSRAVPPIPTRASNPQDDTMEPHPQQPHFMEDPIFMDKVINFLVDHGIMTDASLDVSPAFRLLTTSFAQNANHCADGVRAVVDGRKFKIGITEDPMDRFYNEIYGYGTAAGGNYSKMYLLYVAPLSKPRVPDSTGRMEINLIARFKEDPNCLNKGPGGECPSNGSPHFVYVAVM